MARPRRPEHHDPVEGPERGTRRRWESGDPFVVPLHGPPFARGRRIRGGPGRRRRRGDVRAAALTLLAERPMHGYEMIQELEERTGGVWRPSPGAVYPALQLLEDQGLVTADESDGKRRYQITEAGRAEVPEHAPWEDVTRGVDPVELQLRDAAMQIAVAAQQVGDAGTGPQRAAAVDLLAQTRRGLYAILAEAPPTGDVTGSGDHASDPS